MNTTLWSLVFVPLCALLLLLPFYPAWQEWKHPQDAAALRLHPAQPSASPAQTARHLYLSANTPNAPRYCATDRIVVMRGSRFQQLVAPTIAFGDNTVTARPVPNTDHTRLPLATLPHAVPWGAGGWRVEGDCTVPPAHRLQGPLVVTGRLTIGAGCVLTGDVKARGNIEVRAHAVLGGALLGEQRIALAAHGRVHGPVVGAAPLNMGPGVVIGTLTHPTSVHAPEITASTSAMVHGTAWAHTAGQVV